MVRSIQQSIFFNILTLPTTCSVTKQQKDIEEGIAKFKIGTAKLKKYLKHIRLLGLVRISQIKFIIQIKLPSNKSMLLSEVFLVGLSLYGYLAQVLKFRSTRSIGSFSIYITAVMILSSVVKIFFWVLSRFAIALLIQSVFLIVIHLILIKQYLDLSEYKAIEPNYIKQFWKWNNFSTYILFIVAFAAVLGVLTYVSLQFDLEFIAQFMGIFAALIQVTLALPQIYKGWKTKSMEGVSKTMIGIWVFIDSYKTIYFITNSQPMQFVLTGIIQTILDFVILLEFYLYRKKSNLQIKQE